MATKLNLKLDPRDRLGLIAGGAAVLLVVALLVYIPLGPRQRYLQSERILAEVRQQLVLTQALKADEEARLRSQQRLMELLDARPKDFDFYSYVTGVLSKTKLTERSQVDNYRTRRSSPKQPMVSVKLQGVSLEELVNFLYEIYSSGNLVVVHKMDRLQPADNLKGLDCDLTLATVKV